MGLCIFEEKKLVPSEKYYNLQSLWITLYFRSNSRGIFTQGECYWTNNTLCIGHSKDFKVLHILLLNLVQSTSRLECNAPTQIEALIKMIKYRQHTFIKIRASCFYPKRGSGRSEVAIGVNYVNKCSRLMAGGKKLTQQVSIFQLGSIIQNISGLIKVWIMSTNAADSWLEAKNLLKKCHWGSIIQNISGLKCELYQQMQQTHGWKQKTHLKCFNIQLIFQWGPIKI